MPPLLRANLCIILFELLSSITQTGGTSTGSLFDTKDMKPLTGEAVAEMLRLHEMQNQYGAPDGTLTFRSEPSS